MRVRMLKTTDTCALAKKNMYRSDQTDTLFDIHVSAYEILKCKQIKHQSDYVNALFDMFQVTPACKLIFSQGHGYLKNKTVVCEHKLSENTIFL